MWNTAKIKQKQTWNIGNERKRKKSLREEKKKIFQIEKCKGTIKLIKLASVLRIITICFWFLKCRLLNTVFSLFSIFHIKKYTYILYICISAFLHFPFSGLSPVRSPCELWNSFTGSMLMTFDSIKLRYSLCTNDKSKTHPLIIFILYNNILYFEHFQALWMKLA